MKNSKASAKHVLQRRAEMKTPSLAAARVEKLTLRWHTASSASSVEKDEAISRLRIVAARAWTAEEACAASVPAQRQRHKEEGACR